MESSIGHYGAFYMSCELSGSLRFGLQKGLIYFISDIFCIAIKA